MREIRHVTKSVVLDKCVEFAAVRCADVCLHYTNILPPTPFASILESEGHPSGGFPLGSLLCIFKFFPTLKLEKVVANVEHCIYFLYHVIAGLFTTQFEKEEVCCAVCFRQFTGVCKIAGG